jgi:hypothetical protein
MASGIGRKIAMAGAPGAGLPRGRSLDGPGRAPNASGRPEAARKASMLRGRCRRRASQPTISMSANQYLIS